MRVVAATVSRVKLPLVHEFQTSSHRKTHLEHLLVKLTDESGAEAWGEIASPSDPYYGAETVDTCWTIASAKGAGRRLLERDRLGDQLGLYVEE